MQGTALCDANVVIKNAKKELKRLSQNVFGECFQHICSRWQKCIVLQSDYFGANLA
jgi:hypothetical protein